MSKATGYPSNWREIADAVKEDAGWCCIRCAHPHDPPNGYTLTVHHLDGVPSNCARWNLTALCQRCHLKIQSRVVMEQAIMFMPSTWIMPYLAAFYDHKEDLTSINLAGWYAEYETAIGPWPDWAPKPEGQP